MGFCIEFGFKNLIWILRPKTQRTERSTLKLLERLREIKARGLEREKKSEVKYPKARGGQQKKDYEYLYKFKKKTKISAAELKLFEEIERWKSSNE